MFELLSWNEGFFTFEEGAPDELLPDATVSISTESLLMEGARRIDEWSRIATKISALGLVPRLADIPEERAPQIDLLPNEWEVLSMVDSTRSVREIAHGLGRSDFEVARVLYGLVCTGVVEVPDSGFDAAESGILTTGEHPVSGEIIMNPGDARAMIERVRARSRNGKAIEAISDLKTLLEREPSSAQLHLELGFALAKTGNLNDAVTSWSRYLELDPRADNSEWLRATIESAGRISAAVEEHYHG